MPNKFHFVCVRLCVRWPPGYPWQQHHSDGVSGSFVSVACVRENTMSTFFPPMLSLPCDAMYLLASPNCYASSSLLTSAPVVGRYSHSMSLMVDSISVSAMSSTPCARNLQWQH